MESEIENKYRFEKKKKIFFSDLTLSRILMFHIDKAFDIFHFTLDVVLIPIII